MLNDLETGHGKQDEAKIAYEQLAGCLGFVFFATHQYIWHAE